MSDTATNDNITRRIDPSWRFPSGTLEVLSPFQREFCAIEFARPLDVYVRRCRGMGLAGLGTVLDAGCGMGQWSIAAGMCNEVVRGFDLDSVRLFTARTVAQNLGRVGVSFTYGSLHTIPADESSADAVLCYSVLMFADMDEALREVRRVLRPGGRFLVMVDLWRWHWSRMRSGVLSPMEFAKMGVKRALGRRARILFGEEFFLRRLAAHGFRVHQAGNEGRVTFSEPPTDPDLVFFPEPDVRAPRLLEVAAYCTK